MRELDRVRNLIELLILCHPRGFSILLGEADEPTAREIHEMVDTQRVRMPADFKASTLNTETEVERIMYDSDYFDKSVELAGGWGHIHSVSNEFRNADVRMWSIQKRLPLSLSSSTQRMSTAFPLKAMRL